MTMIMIMMMMIMMARRGMATAPNWAEAVEALSYSKNQKKEKMLDRSRVSET